MKVVAIVQARMGSTRLPGKVLADIRGRSMLWRVCQRTRCATLIDQVVVATTLEPEDRQILDECRRMQLACFRGSTQDVLDRYARAARIFRADIVVRITADCPLIDPQIIDLVVKRGRESFCGSAPLLYASNTLRRTWPRGLDTEVISAAALACADREATEPFERAHVTPYIHRHPELFQLVAVTGPEDLAHARWTVDLPEDLELVRAVYARLPNADSFSWRDVHRLLAQEPALAQLNRHVRQKQLVEG
jgi:spore coat polysaccharide biosynthesis protein SpsF